METRSNNNRWGGATRGSEGFNARAVYNMPPNNYGQLHDSKT